MQKKNNIFFLNNSFYFNHAILKKVNRYKQTFQKFHFDSRFQDIDILKKQRAIMDDIAIAIKNKEIKKQTQHLKPKVHNSKAAFKYFFSQLYANTIRLYGHFGVAHYKSATYRYYNLKVSALKKMRREREFMHFKNMSDSHSISSIENFKKVYGDFKTSHSLVSSEFKVFVNKALSKLKKRRRMKVRNFINPSNKSNIKGKVKLSSKKKLNTKSINLTDLTHYVDKKIIEDHKEIRASVKNLKKLTNNLKIGSSKKKLKKKKFFRKKFIYKKNKISIFRFFYIFFKQQFWIVALFSAFNKNGKKKLAINYYLNIIIFLKKKYKKSSTFFVSLYFNQVMINVMPYICYKRIAKRRKFYRYPYLAGKDFSDKRFRQCKALSIRWIKKSVYSSKRSELSIFLKLWSVLQETRANAGFACFLRRRFYTIFFQRKSYTKLHWLGRWI